MLLYIIFLQYIIIASASYIFRNYTLDDAENGSPEEMFFRFPRQEKPKPPPKFTENTLPCDALNRNELHPFVVILLLGTSGRYLGLGSIIDKKTIISSILAVEKAMKKPRSLLVLAGRLSPWWGEGSQIRHAYKIHTHDCGLAIVELKEQLYFNPHVLPIELPMGVIQLDAQGVEDIYGKQWGVFGVPRTSWHLQGELTAKPSVYVMKVGTTMLKSEHLYECIDTYPDYAYDMQKMHCTYANFTFAWGCIGSPTVALEQETNKLYQIAVITRATFTQGDTYHVHAKVDYYRQWIRSHSISALREKKPPSGSRPNHSTNDVETLLIILVSIYFCNFLL